jgi:hypothetical protein
MIGEGSGIAPDRGLNVLLRVTLNSMMNLTDAGLTAANTCYNSAAADVRITSDAPSGILAGMVVMAGTVNGTAVKSTGVGAPLGVVQNNAVGYPFESGSGVASGKVPYVAGAGTVFSTDVYEVYNSDGATALVYASGSALYCSANGLLTNQPSIGGLNQTVIGIVLVAPTSTDPFMVVQMRI